MGLADMAVAGNRQKEETTPTFYDIRQTTTTLGQRKVNWFGESSRLLEFDRPLTEPGASKLTKVFLATHGRRRHHCPVPLTVRGTQTLVSFAPLAFKLFCAVRQNAVLRRSPFPPPY